MLNDSHLNIETSSFNTSVSPKNTDLLVIGPNGRPLRANIDNKRSFRCNSSISPAFPFTPFEIVAKSARATHHTKRKLKPLLPSAKKVHWNTVPITESKPIASHTSDSVNDQKTQSKG